MELSFDPAKWQFLWLYSLNFERISSLEPTLELRSRVRRSHCAAPRPPHTSPPYGLVQSMADRRPYILVNVSDPTLPDRQKLAEDLKLFRSVQWFREGITASGVFNNRIHA